MSLILSGSDGVSDIDGTAATPAIRGTDTNTGIFFGSDIIGFSEGGAEVARFNADAQFVAAAGTALLPVITTTGDVNTGIFFPAADTIAFSEGGAEAMRIDSSGNVGIGTSSPSAPLQVKANNSSGITFRVQGRSSDGYGSLGYYNNAVTTLQGQVDVNNSGMYFGTTIATPIQFYTNDTEKMRITSGGNLCINTTNTINNAAFVNIKANPATNWCIATQALVTDSYNAAVFFNLAAADVGTIVVGASSTAYNTSSDYRLKENIAPMTGALSKVAALKPVTYKWKVDGSSGQGFIAHELQEIAPYAVTGEKDGEQMQVRLVLDRQRLR
jgi:hypothetical protein